MKNELKDFWKEFRKALRNMRGHYEPSKAYMGRAHPNRKEIIASRRPHKRIVLLDTDKPISL